MPHPWDQRKGESDAAYAAFQVFLDIPKISVKTPEFSRLVKEKKGVDLAPSYLADLQTDNRWRERKRAYQSHILTRNMKNVTWKVTIEAPIAAKGRSKLRNMVRERAIAAVERTGTGFIDESDAKQANAYMDWLAKALNLGCLTDLDHADQLRKLFAERSRESDSGPSESEDLIPPIPPEPGCVQYDGTEAEAVLESTTGDLPGDS